MAYGDGQKAEVLAILASNGGRLRQTARQTGVAESTLRLWASDGRVTSCAQKKSEDLADRMEALTHAIVDMMPEKLQAANLRDLAVTLGIIVDKMLLLRGQPTERIHTSGDSDEATCAARVMELLEKARTRTAAIAGTH
jgi:hypothetical protein